jgi:hypothetical protein
MSSYNPQRLCRPDILRAIDARYLEELLSPHAEVLRRHGITLPLAGREAPLKYLALAQLLIAPEKGMPAELVDALYFIDELATPTGIEALEAAGAAKGIRIPKFIEVTPAEIVLKFWLLDPQVVQRVHAEIAARRLRSFEYFQPETPDLPQLAGCGAVAIHAMESELNESFHARRRGRYARILTDEQKDRMWFYIGHGGMLRREATIEDSGPSSICYRPKVYDVLVYERTTGELGIHGRSEWERTLYQRVVGKHLFGNERLFVGKAKYTLDPFWEYGRAALECVDVPGIKWVKLIEMTTLGPGESPLRNNYQCDDLFAQWGRLNLSPDTRLVSASMRVKLVGARGIGRVTLRPSNRAEYSGDVDPRYLDPWLERRGFIRRRGGHAHARSETLLAVA